MAEAHSPTVRRRRLGIELRSLREAARKSIEDVAVELECSGSKISRIETGKSGVIHLRDVRDMLDMYGVTDQQKREDLFAIAKDAQQTGWWAEYEMLPGFEAYVGLEAEASSIRAFEPNVLHGLLQTNDYAQAVLQAARIEEGHDSIEQYVAVRMHRQAVLTRQPEPLRLWVIQDEAALRRPIGGATVTRAQFQRLLELTDMPNVTVQVLPFAAGAHAGLAGSFNLIELPEPAVPPVVYLEAADNLYLERPRQARRYALAFDDLCGASLSPDASIRFLHSLVDEIT